MVQMACISAMFKSVLFYGALGLVTIVMTFRMLPILFPFFPSLSKEQTSLSSLTASSQKTSNNIDLNWYPPSNTLVNSLSSAVNSSGTYGFIFNSSDTPSSVPFSTYNWCSMPHVRPQEYIQPPTDRFKLEYVELIHRHHKRTPYAANTFPIETQQWSCHDSALFYYGTPLDPGDNSSAQVYWEPFIDAVNPFSAEGFPPYDCQFPQITRGGLDDSWQHGLDLYAVYHTKLQLIPASAPSRGVDVRVTNNQITSQVSGMVLNGMFNLTTPFPLHLQPLAIDSLEPTYSCPSADSAFASFGPGSRDPTWTSHLAASQPLYKRLDAISGVSPTSSDWHVSWDHYFDNLSARLCHNFSLPCDNSDSGLCVGREDADEVFRLGEWEYSWQYRGAPGSLNASAASYGVWIAELTQHLRDFRDDVPAARDIVYRYNIAHDGSLARLLSVLQLDVMVWPGMGAEVVFELYSGLSGHEGWFVRVLWGGQTLRSSNPSLGVVDMLPLENLLGYFDGLVGARASLIREKCSTENGDEDLEDKSPLAKMKKPLDHPEE